MANSLFEKTDVWVDYDSSDTVANKIPLIEKLIPKDTRNIIDVGCGNGIITDHLDKSYDVTGVDSSATALTYVKAKTLQNNITEIQVKDRSFDFVLCSEVLEHLPDDILVNACAELRRISKKYILITVPHNEYLPLTHVKCDECGNIFHAYEHLQSFKREDVVRLFSEDFTLVDSFIDGPERLGYHPVLLRIRQQRGNRYFHPPQEKGYCDKCGNTTFPTKKGNIVSKVCNQINKMTTKKHKYWLFCLFERVQG